MSINLLTVAHEMATGLHKAGIIDVKTMRQFDVDCLPLVTSLEPQQIKLIRKNAGVSQSVFAKLLNASLSTVRQWEQGKKHPCGISLKLLNLVEKKGLNVLVV